MNSRKVLWIVGVVVLVGALIAGANYYFVRQMPDLDRPFTPAERYPESIRQESIQKVESAIAELRENPELVSRWLELAVYRKGADDYEGAEDIWLYMTYTWPAEPTAYGNLADLYQSVLVEPRKAEKYWKKYIEVAPANYDIGAYRSLHDLYRTKLSNPDRAREILLQALKENPETTDLIIPLAVFERMQGNVDAARMYFTQAKEIADKLGNTSLSSILNEELKALEQ